MIEPKVSVIVPIYNVEKYLDECMESLLNQTLKDIEIIMVDDESPDRCPQMCDEYARKDSRVKVIHKKNGGLGFARNSGLEVATGEYVIFIDSDDFVSHDMLEKLYTTAKAYQADEVRSGVVFYRNGVETIRRDVDRLTVFQGEKEVRRFVLDLCGPKPEDKRDCKYMMSVCLALHSRRVIEEHHVRFTSERETLSEDLIFDLDLFPHMQCIVYMPDCFYRYRANPSSLTHQFSMEKYRKYAVFLDLVKERLASVFSEEEYRLHHQRLSFLYLRNAISAVIHLAAPFREKQAFFNTILRDSFWGDLLQTYPYQRMEWKHRLYFSCLKRKFSLALMFAHRAIL